MTTPPLSLDQQLLHALKKRDTLFLQELEQKLALSRPTIHKKIRRFEHEQIITSWGTIINPNAFERHTLAFIRTNPTEPNILLKLLQIPDLVTLSALAGTWTLVGKFAHRSYDHFLAFIDQLDTLIGAENRYLYFEILSVFKTQGIVLPEGQSYDKFHLEESDLALLHGLHNLQSVERPSLSNIAEKLAYDKHLSTLGRRIKELKKKNLILAFSIMVNDLDNKKLKFYVQIKIAKQSLAPLITFLQQMPEIISLYRIGYEYSLVAIVESTTVQEFNQCLKRIYKQGGVLDTFSSLVLEEYKRELTI